MIRVLASIRVKPQHLAEFLGVFKANVPAVLAEEGCLEYVPMVDTDTGIPAQEQEPGSVTVVEAWESSEALAAHLQVPHMRTYREAVREWVTGVSLKVLQPA